MAGANKPELDITIDEDGNIVLEVNGCEGSVCENITDALLQRMGTVEDVVRKPEFYVNNDRPDYINTGNNED